MFTAQQVWDLTLNITKAISKTTSRFGLPAFKINFLGAKGVHMLLAIENPEVITDSEHYVNFSELYTTLLPCISTLKKEKISTLNNTFKFAKSLLQSILLYTVYITNIEIPEELDCSSMSRGVVRLFSPHPTSKLVSIPLSDDKFSEKYLDYDTVREDAKLENVVERFKTGDISLFQSKLNKVNRSHIKSLLRPDKLLPAFAVLLRFGTISQLGELHYLGEFIYSIVITTTSREITQLVIGMGYISQLHRKIVGKNY